SPRSDLDSQPFSSPSSSSSLSLPLQLPFVQQFFLSFVWVIVRLYFPVARHARFARASIPRCSLIGAHFSHQPDLTPLEAFIV
ncbi:hypothetical protein N7516_006363, partial [Penicillium verrucosum]|uniref:uncharacterized protein n=1 Tax=Penicillium verrucosum TaxID=60171 RepID=UPI0025453725